MNYTMVSIAGSIPLNKHPQIGFVHAGELIEVTIKLRRKTEEGLTTLEEFVDGKRRFMARQELQERYGASADDADAVAKWATQQALTVSDIDLGRRQLILRGTAVEINKAFGLTLALYRHGRTGRQFRCPTGDIQIPQELASIIVGVFGMNNMPVVVRGGARPTPKALNDDPKQMFPGSFYPHEVAQLYSFPSTQGKGQKVAILEFGGGFDQEVLKDYFTNAIGLATPPTVNGISVLNTPIAVDQEFTGEVYLDIEVIGAMAPQAAMDVFFAPFTGRGYLAAIEEAIHNGDYASISISYGLDEDLRGTNSDPGWPMLNKNIDEAFKEATAIGIPVFVSSGDQGSSSLRGALSNGQEITLLAPAAHAGYPATSPYATAVGGTMLYASGGAITQEVVWNELGQLEQGKFYLGGATGGGVSDRYTTVPSYQSGAGVTSQSVNVPAVTGRSVPDVAGNSGASTGYLVSQPPGSQFPIAPVGGTSAAAPMWAALMACIRESLNAEFAGNIPVFFFNDFVYACGNTPAFRDIVGGIEVTYAANGAMVPGQFTAIGNNRSSQVNGYYAQKGFDLCTGWGSPNGAELLNQLVAWLKK